MKLATLKTSHPDGALLVCNKDLTRAAPAEAVAATMREALDGWARCRPLLEQLARDVEGGRAAGMFDLNHAKLAAPLPRPACWMDSSVYLNHMELARRLRGVETPKIYYQEPLLSPRVPSPFLGGHDPVQRPAGDVGLDIEAEVAVILAEVPAAPSLDRAGRSIALLTLVNDISLRTVLARELAAGKSIYHGKSVPAMAPVAVTPDELGSAWDDGKIALPLVCRINGQLLGRPNAGVDMYFSFPQMVADAALRRPLPAGTVLGAGTVSNRDRSAGSACIAEARMIETLDHGAPRTNYLVAGDTLHIEMTGVDGRSVFGAIAQTVVDL